MYAVRWANGVMSDMLCRAQNGVILFIHIADDKSEA